MCCARFCNRPHVVPRTRAMTFAIKAQIGDPRLKTFAFISRKTMHGGKLIAEGDMVFLFASETQAAEVSSLL